MKKIGKKGMISMGDIMWLGLSIITVVIVISIFIPFAEVLNTTTINIPNSGLIMTLTYLIPVLIVAGVIWSFMQKAESNERY